jgi:hypothetical protein
MAAVGIVALVLPLLAVIVALGWMVLPYRQLLGAMDLKRLYLCMVSLLALVLAAVALLLAVQVATRMLLGADPAAGLLPAGLRQGRSDQPWDLPPRDSLARNLGWFVVAAPMWLWYYRGAVRRSLSRQAWTIHRLYLYAVDVLFLVTNIGFSAAVVAQGPRALLDLVDLSSQAAVREFWKCVVGGLLDGGICAALWGSHYRAIPPSGAT